MLAIVGLYVALFLATFLLGSIPWGVIISKLAFKKDLRDEGSGNIGTTNAMRTLGKAGGAAVFVLDFGKGLVAGWIGTLVAAHLATTMMAAASETGAAIDPLYWNGALSLTGLALAVSFAGCTLGHIFSPWLGWKGGKGIAVAAACLVFVFGPLGFIIEVSCFVIGIVVTRCVSVGSIAAAAVCPVLGLYFYWGEWVPWLIIAITAGVVIWAHRANIARLRAGTENKIGSKKREAA
ncbi:glycerol-3-phosphate 1-O-acyltransferase PlsY [Adlercreutzia sp. R25]|uniref:Glycerol-3-phosphate acyltransferase n=1 Tax=Adlercreutzia shanghongiae TaxID=3111773 RepID=A0ABU6IXM0_9ACTN|nr:MULTISPECIES: glycerol-3-phosphate 1-O-acyltransferase PlsY [unclassified Adlercreutzia]MEC4272512.1 glycerol-3-phosphate 1-O-acyltransferase PlsY [Adlercreutzia sp. R25]MEC4294588.1 glycerol-3-phosphate 1-O-acyltransferase PlsY [Adlercreutzia sp. R22]